MFLSGIRLVESEVNVSYFSLPAVVNHPLCNSDMRVAVMTKKKKKKEINKLKAL